MKWLAFKIRWWKWFLFDGAWPARTLYFGPYRLDADSRRVIIERHEREWLSRAPKRK